MDAAHSLFETRRVPGDVIVHHQPAELKVDALARSVGGDQIVSTLFRCRPAKELDLPFPFLVGHSPVNRGNLSGETKALKPMDQEIDSVAMLREYDELCAGILPGPPAPPAIFRTWTPPDFRRDYAPYPKGC